MYFICTRRCVKSRGLGLCGHKALNCGAVNAAGSISTRPGDGRHVGLPSAAVLGLRTSEAEKNWNPQDAGTLCSQVLTSPLGEHGLIVARSTDQGLTWITRDTGAAELLLRLRAEHQHAEHPSWSALVLSTGRTFRSNCESLGIADFALAWQSRCQGI